MLYKFKGGADGTNPAAGLVLDSAGNLYGTAFGAAYEDGVVFKLTPRSDGTWRQSVLHTFRGSDGVGSYGSLIFDTAGSLYGTSIQGGAYGYGAVFKLAPNSGGTWTESVLHSFNSDGKDGFQLTGGLVFDVAGNLYGTTMYGGDTSAGCPWGPTGCGTVFKLAPNPDGSWTESVLYSFADGPDGASPATGLLFDNDGNLYGTARFGGVFKLAPKLDGSWTESLIGGIADGSDLTFDGTANLYFTTWGYGPQNYGVVWDLVRNADGTWSPQAIRYFAGRPGKHPLAGLVRDAAGNLYGTTTGYSENTEFYGTVFKLTPNQDGSWAFRNLHVFNGKDGARPTSKLILDGEGNLYGTTAGGGRTDLCSQGCGVVFKITQ